MVYQKARRHRAKAGAPFGFAEIGTRHPLSEFLNSGLHSYHVRCGVSSKKERLPNSVTSPSSAPPDTSTPPRVHS